MLFRSINQSTTLRPSVENRSSIAASNPVVTIVPSGGLRIDSASWPVGNCTVSGGQARCTATSLAANSTQTIEVQITGVAEGQQRYTVSATADEDDRNTSNNSSTSQLNVTAVSTGPSGGEDSGGGSLGFAMLLLLFSALVLRFRRRRAEAAGSVEDSYDNALADKIIGLYKTELLRQRGPWTSIDIAGCTSRSATHRRQKVKWRAIANAQSANVPSGKTCLLFVSVALAASNSSDS